jgi:tetratricopeptide (TPR) repeat protein
MSDSSLESLSFLTPDQSALSIEPKFKQKILNYSCLIPSSHEKFQVDTFTSDPDASYRLFIDGKSSEDKREFIIFNPNEKKVLKLLVESSDGKKSTEYNFTCTRLSASSAILSDLAFQTEKKKSFKKSAVELEPEFNPDVTDYTVKLLDFTCLKLLIRTKYPDSGTSGSLADAEEVCLKAALTKIELIVTSPDKSNTKSYRIIVIRQGPAIALENKGNTAKCFLTNTVAFPILKIGEKSYNQEFFEMLTRLDRSDPITGETLVENWFEPSAEALGELEKSVPDLADTISSLKSKFDRKIIENTTDVTETDWFKKCKTEGFSMSSEIRSKFEAKTKDFEKFVEKLARNAHPTDTIDSIKKEAVVDLERLANTSAKTKNFVELGFALELKNHEKWLGLNKNSKKSSERQDEGLKIKQSGWEDDIKVVMEMHGIAKSANLEDQLRALDMEYQALKDSGADQNKQDHVQELYEYKQRQAVERAQRAGKVTSDEELSFYCYFANVPANSPKMLDLLYLGRALFKLGSLPEAEYVLQHACSMNPENLETRVYLNLVNSGIYKFSELVISANEKHLLSTTFKDTTKQPFDSIKHELINTDIWKCYKSGDPRLMHLLWSFICKLETGSLAYQQTAWAILENSREIFAANSVLVMLSEKLKFTDSARVAKFHLELEIQSLCEIPRCNDILNKIGLYSLEIAGDEDDRKLAFENVDNAIECFASSIKFEGESKVEGEMPNLPWVKKEVEVKKSTEKLPAGKTPAKTPVKTQAKPVAKGKPIAKPVAKTPAKPPAKPAAKGKPAPGKPSATKITENPSTKPDNGPKNVINLKTRLYLAKAYKQKFDLDEGDQKVKDSAIKAYETALEKLPKNTEASIDLARLITATDSMKAVDLYCSCDESLITKEDQCFISGEVVNILLKKNALDDKRLEKHMILWAKEYGLGMLDKAVDMCEKAKKTTVLRRVYCAVHGKDENDSDLKQFFMFKCW